MSMNCCTVITTIRGYDAVKQWAGSLPMIVVGDAKTPSGWSTEHNWLHYLPVREQHERWPELAQAIPLNWYGRKMLGYLRAKELGFTHVFETDDDNYPLDTGWTQALELAAVCATNSGLAKHRHNAWVNTYAHFGQPGLWPRGFPISLVTSARRPDVYELSECTLTPAVWQFMHNGAPDLDAVGHMLAAGRPYYFDASAPPIRLLKDQWAPYNSQATLFSLDMLWVHYIPVTCGFRVTDILRGYLSLPHLWAAGKTVEFRGPLVEQKRNDHDLGSDLLDEAPLLARAQTCSYLGTNWERSFELLKVAKLVSDVDREIKTYEMWRRSCESVS